MTPTLPEKTTIFLPPLPEGPTAKTTGVFPRNNLQFCRCCNFAVRYRTVISCVALSIYLLMGALVFRSLESQTDDEEKRKLLDMLDKLSKTSNITGKEAIELIAIVAKAINTGFDIGTAVDDFKNGRSLDHDDYLSRWTVAGGYFFSTTVITTIGYGHMSPATRMGRIFCVLYALVGIPLCFMVTGYIQACYTALYRVVLKCLKIHRDWLKFIVALLFLCCGCGMFVALPAWMFIYSEGWNLENGFYASITTLTTVGFGDFVPGIYQSRSNAYRYFLSVWIYLGLAYVTMFPSLIGHCFAKLIGYHKCKIPPPKNLYDHEKL